MKKIFVILFILFAVSVEAANPPSRVYTYSSGTVIQSAHVTANEDALYNWAQDGVNHFEDGSIVNADINASANIQSDKLNLTAIAQSVANSGSTTLTGTFAANGTTNSIGNGGSDTLILNVPGGMTLSAATTWTLTGALTFSGTIADLGTVTTADINGGTLDGVQIGSTTETGELIVNDSNDDADGLGDQGTSGQFLQSAGAGANPTWITLPRVPYFIPESNVVLAFDNAESLVDLSLSRNVLTPTDLVTGDLVAGKVSNSCYDFSGTNDYVTVTANSLWNGMPKFTFEVWYYKDVDSNLNIINDTAGNDFYISPQTSVINILIDFVGGAININPTHGLSGNGIGQWVYFVITYDGTDVTPYVNGVAKSGTTTSGNTQNIGTLQIGADGGATSLWNGKIDGMRLTRGIAMSAADILARYNYYK